MEGTRTQAATVLRLEGAAALLLAAYAYHAIEGPWLWFAILFLMPDVFMLGYLKSRRLGAATYNIAHTYLFPFAILLLWLIVRDVWVLRIAAIWAAHIGLDRLLGFGLKDPAGFKHTHLQRV